MVFYGHKEVIFRGDVEKFVGEMLSRSQFTGHDALSFDEGFDWEDICPILQTLVNERVLYVDKIAL